MFDGMHDGWMWGMHWGWWIFWVLAVASTVWLISRVQQDRAAPPPTTPAREAPLQVLQRRYAKGEISTDEYEERRRRLERDA